MKKGRAAEGATRSTTEARGAGLGGVLKGRAAGGVTRSTTEAQGAGLDGVKKGSAAEGATKSTTEARGAGLGSVLKGRAVGGATRSTTEARGAGLGGVKKGSAAEGATRSTTEARGAGLDGVVKGNFGQAKSKTKAKYQTTLWLLHPKVRIGQTALCLQHPKAGIGQNALCLLHSMTCIGTNHALRREVSEFNSHHDVICQVGVRRFPAHSYVLASSSKSLSKQLRFAERQEEQEQEMVQVEEVYPVIFQLVPQLLYTETCDPFQDGATAASLATLELQEQQDILKEVSEFDSLNDTKGNDGSRYYLLVDPRPGEAPDYDYSTSVQCTGTGRSTGHNRNVMYNTLHSQHLKDEGVEWYLEASECDSLHSVICQGGHRRFPAHS